MSGTTVRPDSDTHVGVTEPFLDLAQGGAAFEHVDCSAVAKSAGRNNTSDLGALRVLPKKDPVPLAGQSLARRAPKIYLVHEDRGLPSVPDQQGTAILQIGFEYLDNAFGDLDDALPGVLAVTLDVAAAFRKVEVVQIKGDELIDVHAGGVE